MKFIGNLRGRVCRLLSVVGVAVPLSGCAGANPVDVLARAVEGMARGACGKAENCRNVCRDGSEARGPLYRCPGTKTR